MDNINNYQMFFPAGSSSCSPNDHSILSDDGGGGGLDDLHLHQYHCSSDYHGSTRDHQANTNNKVILMQQQGEVVVNDHDCINGTGGSSSSGDGVMNNTNKVVGGGGNKKVRKPRYAFQTRSQVDILDDGYRWRKYGQKAVKNNKFPRSYYRCTHEGCNVKKQVQRLTKDENVVVTTYEGMHTHPIDKPTDNFDHILTQMQIYTTTTTTTTTPF